MAENSSIEWTDHTFNPWIGCTKVSPGCDHCYAEARMDTRLHVVQWGPGAQRKRTREANWLEPLRWNERAEAAGRRERVFCASLADVFDNEVPSEWLADLLNLVRSTPNLDWLLLTKRIGNWRKRLEAALAMAALGEGRTRWPGLAEWIADWLDSRAPASVWIGASIVNQAEADRDVPKLLATPARVRFLSMEPLLGPVDLRDGLGLMGCPGDLDWVIVGGESGPGARPMHPDWARSLRDQCAAAGVPFLLKQWGEWVSVSEVAGAGEHHRFSDGATVRRTGKKTAGRLLDGRMHDEFPEVA